MKLLTVITVTYNAEKCIERTMRSVIGQSVFDEQIEYIVVDGASKDGTMQIVNQYREKLALVISEPDHGIYDAMNKGIRMATAPWICFMNAGDTFLDNDVVDSLHLVSFKQCIHYGDCIRLYADGHTELRKARPFFDHPGQILGVGICHQAVIQPTVLMQQHPFRWEEYPHCADFEFLWAMHQQGVKFHYLDRPLCYYEYGQGFSSDKQANRIVFEENARIAHLTHTFGYWKRCIKDWLHF